MDFAYDFANNRLVSYRGAVLMEHSPPFTPARDLVWKNEDWIRVYGALKELVLFYDLEYHKVGRANWHMSDQQNLTLKLIEKLEFMFRDEPSEATELRPEFISRTRIDG